MMKDKQLLKMIHELITPDSWFDAVILGNGVYTQTFCNLAEEEGLGLCFLGTTVYMPQMIIDVLQLPELVMPVATITLGWPAEEPALSDRLPVESFIHSEKYSDYKYRVGCGDSRL